MGTYLTCLMVLGRLIINLFLKIKLSNLKKLRIGSVIKFEIIKLVRLMKSVSLQISRQKAPSQIKKPLAIISTR